METGQRRPLHQLVLDAAFSALDNGGASMIDTLFEKGAGLYGAGIIAAAFVAVAMLQHKKRQGSPEKDDLYQWETSKVLMKAVLPGFVFGSEVFLVMGLSVEAPLGVESPQSRRRTL